MASGINSLDLSHGQMKLNWRLEFFYPSFRETAIEGFSASFFFLIYQVVFGIEDKLKDTVSQLLPTELIVHFDSWLLYPTLIIIRENRMILNRSLNKSILKIGFQNRPRVENTVLLLLKFEVFWTQRVSYNRGNWCFPEFESGALSSNLQGFVWV